MSDRGRRGRGRARGGFRGNRGGVYRGRGGIHNRPTSGDFTGLAQTGDQNFQNRRGNDRGRGRGRGGHQHEREELRAYPWSLLEQLNSDYDGFKCLTMCTKEEFGLALDVLQLQPNDQRRIALLLSVVKKALESTYHNQNEYINTLADMLFERENFLQSCFNCLLMAINGGHIQPDVIEPILLNFLAIADRLMTIDWHRAQSVREAHIKTLYQMMTGLLHGTIKQEIIEKYASAVDSLVQRAKDQMEIERREIMEARAKAAGRVLSEKKPARGEFRHEPVHPTKDMVSQKIVEIRKNHPEGAFDDDDDYLDIQFRLLREDLVASLREAITEMSKRGSLDDSDARLYRGLKVIAPNFGRDGVNFVIQFDQSDTMYKRVRWKVSKRLIYGSLLCLSTDSFKKVIIFATVSENDGLSKGGNFEVQILPFSEDDMERDIQLGSTVDVLESAAYYEAYRHVLGSMQAMRSVPFSNYIVHLSSHVKKPRYLEVRPSCEYELMGKIGRFSVRPARPYALWPSHKQLGLNATQFKAYKAALTEEFSLIQGPPGTGKTYVGLKIAQVLFHNLYGISQTSDSEDDEIDEELRPIHTPLLVVCYTNHALDQFLEGVSEFCDLDDVVRVGSQSKSEKLKNCHLFKKPKLKGKGGHGKEIYQLREEISQIQNSTQLKNCVAWLKRSYNSIVFDEWLPLNDGERRDISSFVMNSGIPKQNRKFALYYWLGVEAAVLKETKSEGNDPSDGASSGRQAHTLLDDEYGDEDNLIDIEDGDDRELLDDDFFVSSQLNRGIDQLTLQEITDSATAVDDEGFTRTITKKEKQTAKKKIAEELNKTSILSHEVGDYYLMAGGSFLMDIDLRWQQYRRWLKEYRDSLINQVTAQKKSYNRLVSQLKSIRLQEDKRILASSKIIGMTTTGAARYHEVLEQIGPEIVIIEEAAEVLEAHVITSLSANCKHVILIGDHKQLRPNPNVYDLARNYNLDLSLFERMINNNLSYVTLDEQHRMRPSIQMFMTHIYPELKNHPSVKGRPHINGIGSPVYFLHHTNDESSDKATHSKSNEYEAKYIVELCRYLMRREYKPSEITVITMYVGQLLLIRSLMPKLEFQGIKITSVDNFQGEENRIILLSLVRSNSKANLGFVAIENRICVSLSRAREGMYVLGNMGMLAKGSGLWKKIIETAQKHRLLGNKLPISCVNHGKSQFVEKPEDFKTLAPRGGCGQICGGSMSCGHKCPQICHYIDPNHKEFLCQEPCVKLLNCGHPCKDKCSRKQCPPCKEPKSVIMPKCSHPQTIFCHQSEHQISCQFDLQIFCDRCYQTKTVKCHEKNHFKCNTVCGKKRSCGHKCTGTCDTCKNGCVDLCKSSCGKELNCGHICPKTCCVSNGEECGTCSQKCPYKCSHGAPCLIECGDHVGKLCWYDHTDRCQNGCSHSKCVRSCSEPCSHLPCMLPCDKQTTCMSCKNLAVCISVCGERCIFKCAVCDYNELIQLQEDYPDGFFIRLRACGHVFEIAELRMKLELKKGSKGHLTPKCPQPTCNQLIVESRFKYLAYKRS